MNWNTNATEDRLITKIAKRAVEMCGDSYSLQDAQMDITACHLNGCPLELENLLNTDDFNFAHDVFGIRRHLNRQTGQLENHFLPRYAQRVTA